MIACPASKRSALLLSCASLAVGATLSPAHAQQLGAFQGTISSTTGSVTRTPMTSTTETITIGSNTATIDWTPTDRQQGGGPIDFLPNGNTATFTSTSGLTDYTVLNRIHAADSTRWIALNGHVISTLQGTGATGGKIWFYSPSGIVVGASAVFDVGGLLLTTTPVSSLTTDANGFSANFGGPAGARSPVLIAQGARINALQPGSYVAIVAPLIEQGGDVRVNGSAAYAAAQQLSMTMNQGLFDIQVDVGTDDPTGIVHTGSTTGPANIAAADNHGIYMVAVPKNQALTMLLGGTVGFDATRASVQNGQIVLSAGYSVSGTSFDKDGQGGAMSAPLAGIAINGGHFTSSVTGQATGEIEASGGGGNLTFDGDLTLQGLSSATLAAYDGETVSVKGNARISADDLRQFDTSDPGLALDAQGGWAEVMAESGGTLTIGGSANVTADALSATNVQTLTGGTSRGGVAIIDSSGGNISIGGSAHVSASALGDAVSHAGIDGRDSSGGNASIIASGGGSIHIGGALDLLADAQGSISALAAGGTGGGALGGYAGMQVDDASLDVAGPTRVSAAGTGGGSTGSGGGGAGDGGTAVLILSSGGRVGFGGGATFAATGTGANSSGPAGTGTGGSAQLLMYGGTVSSTGGLTFAADGTGGSGTVGGDGWGGYVDLFALDSGNSITSSGTTFSARGTGGAGTSSGGSGNGGTASVYLSSFVPDGAVASSSLSDEGLGSSLSLGDLAVNVRGDGGSAGAGTGGAAYGGEADISMDSGELSLGSLSMTAGAAGGSGKAGGDASAGSLNLILTGGSAAINGKSEWRVEAQGGAASEANGGEADGGSIEIQSGPGGTLQGSDLLAIADAKGGDGGTDGSGYGGSVYLHSDSWGSGLATSLSFGNVQLSANGSSGAGGGESMPVGLGGSLSLQANSATLDVGSLSAVAEGSDFGGSVFVGASGGYGDLTGALRLGSTSASVDSPGSAGAIVVASNTGSSVDLGSANLHASGASDGLIELFAGGCDRGEGDRASARESAPAAGAAIRAADLTLASTGEIDLATFGDATIGASGNLKADADLLSLNASGGPISAANADLNATNIFATGLLSFVDARFNASEDMTIGDLSVSKSATFAAGGVADFEGVVSAPTITVTSRDINVADGAKLGVFGVTNLLTLNALSDGQPVLLGDGGSPSEGQYELNEDGDLEAKSLVINAVASGEGAAPDIHVYDAEIDGSATPGGGFTSVTLDTAGSVLVLGKAEFANAGATDMLAIHAGKAIEVNTDSGSVRISGSGGKPAGTLELEAGDIWVGDGSLLSKLEADRNFTGRDTVLKTNNGAVTPEGYVQAATITAAVSNSFLVQNSGTPDLFGGITTGDGGLTVTSSGTTPATVVAYGRQDKSNGTTVTNKDFFSSVGFSGSGGFTKDSTLNGCVIGGSCGQQQVSVDVDYSSILGPIGDDKKKDKKDDKGSADNVDSSLRLINTTPMFTDHTIDEPVTSGANVNIGNPGGTH